MSEQLTGAWSVLPGLALGCAILLGCADTDDDPQSTGTAEQGDTGQAAESTPAADEAGAAGAGAGVDVGGEGQAGEAAPAVPPVDGSPVDASPPSTPAENSGDGDGDQGMGSDAVVELTWLGNSVWVAKYVHMGEDKVVVLDTNIGSSWPALMETLGVQHVDYVFCGHGNSDHCDLSDAVIGTFGGQLIAARSNCTKYGQPDCLAADDNPELTLDDAGLFVTAAPVEHSFGTRETGEDPYAYAIRFPNGFTMYYLDTVGPLEPSRAGVVAQLEQFPDGVTLFVSMVASAFELASWVEVIEPKYYIPQHTPLLDFTPNVASVCFACATNIVLDGVESFSHADYITTYEATADSVVEVDKGYREAFRN